MKFKLVENIGYGLSRQELIAAIKELGYNYNFNKYTDQQLYNILNERNRAYEKDIQDTYNQIISTPKLKYEVIEDDNGIYHVYDNDIEIAQFSSEDDLIDAGYLTEEKKYKQKHPMGYFTRFNRDPEKSMEIFNHNMGADKGSSSTADTTGGEAGSSGGE